MGLENKNGILSLATCLTTISHWDIISLQRRRRRRRRRRKRTLHKMGL
jgi:hypothetical protein